MGYTQTKFPEVLQKMEGRFEKIVSYYAPTNRSSDY